MSTDYCFATLNFYTILRIAEIVKEFISLARQNNYDLILMDMQMPELDGIEATKKIRKIPNCKNIPIIAFTANAFFEDKQKCLEAGMSDYISKPIIPEVLFDKINEWI